MRREDVAIRLEKEIGLDPEVLGSEALGRLLASGMRRTATSTEPSYLERLFTDDREWTALIEDVVVPETWFLRDRGPFDLITRRAALWTATTKRPLRALSLPCSTGEEAYSMAIALREGDLFESRFSITAVDLSERNLQAARTARYRERSVRLVSPEMRTRYFRAVDEALEVVESLRDRVTFVRGNVLDDQFMESEKPFDLILCRNLLIYLTTAARRHVLAWLDRRMADDGLLIVGHAERNRLLDARFDAMDERGAFAHRKRRVTAEVAKSPPKRPASVRETAPIEEPKRPRPIETAAQGNKVETELEAARRLANDGSFLQAIEACERHLRREGPSAAAHHLAGAIRLAAGDPEAAEREHRRAIYLDPNHAEALLALSLLARRRGEPGEADRLARRAERALRRGSP